MVKSGCFAHSFVYFFIIKVRGDFMGSSMNTAKRVEAQLSGTAEEMGFEIVDVEFVKEGQN